MAYTSHLLPFVDQCVAVLRDVSVIRIQAPDGSGFYETCPSCWADLRLRGGHVAHCALMAVLAHADGQ